VNREDCPTLRAGDIVLVNHRPGWNPLTWGSYIVGVMQRRIGEEPTLFKHVGMMVSAFEMYESAIWRSRIVDLFESYGDAGKYDVMIARDTGLTPTQIIRLTHLARQSCGQPYGFLKIGAHFGDWLLTMGWGAVGGRSDVYAFRWLCRLPHFPICSYKIARLRESIHRPFGKPAEVIQPDDIGDEILRCPASGPWRIVFETDRLEARLADTRSPR